MHSDKQKLEYWTQIIKDWEQSGKSITQFTMERGISKNRFSYWLPGVRREQNKFVPLFPSGQESAKPISRDKILLSLPGDINLELPSSISAAFLKELFH